MCFLFGVLFSFDVKNRPVPSKLTKSLNRYTHAVTHIYTFSHFLGMKTPINYTRKKRANDYLKLTF